MQKSAISKAEEKFAASKKKDELEVRGREKAEQEIVERIAKQRALRLDHEAALKKTADEAAAKKSSAKSKNKSKKR